MPALPALPPGRAQIRVLMSPGRAGIMSHMPQAGQGSVPPCPQAGQRSASLNGPRQDRDQCPQGPPDHAETCSRAGRRQGCPCTRSPQPPHVPHLTLHVSHPCGVTPLHDTQVGCRFLRGGARQGGCLRNWSRVNAVTLNVSRNNDFKNVSFCKLIKARACIPSSRGSEL